MTNYFTLQVDNRFVHYDSLSKSNDGEGIEIQRKLAPFTGNAPFTNNRMCKKQTNSYDCGPHVLTNAEFVSDHVTRNPNASVMDINSPSATAEDAAEMRQKILHLIAEMVRQNQQDNVR